MKMIISLIVIGSVACGILADDRFVERPYRKKSFPDSFLGIVSISVPDRVNLHFLGSLSNADQKKMLQEKLASNLPRALKEASSCGRVEVCSTVELDSMSPRRLSSSGGPAIRLNLPSGFRFPNKKEAKPKYCLFVEITGAYDDSSTAELSVNAIAAEAAGIPSGERFVESKPPEECLHLACNYAFINCGSGDLICYGKVTAEGCGLLLNRYGPLGIWAASIKDLAGEIVEESPFEMKTLDASDFH
jgi:hypothetical protein